MLSNAYFLAKFRFDTAENERAKKLQNFANFANFAEGAHRCEPLGREGAVLAHYREHAREELAVHLHLEDPRVRLERHARDLGGG